MAMEVFANAKDGTGKVFSMIWRWDDHVPAWAEKMANPDHGLYVACAGGYSNAVIFPHIPELPADYPLP